ncbi:hypothetical protein B9N66_06925 [Campylobacter concisus]|nr:hypothetical protein B9N66_06925 [Campylobacter concisus]
MVFEVTESEVKVRQYPKSKICQIRLRRHEGAHHKAQKEKGFILGRVPGKKSKSSRHKSKSISAKRLEYL